MKPIRLYLIVLTCLVTLVPDSARAQKFINLDDELGIGYVETVFQDSYGLLWIGSRNGLHSYDGYNVTSYVNDPTDPTSIPDNTAYSLS